MSEIRTCKYCGMELSEDVPHGLRECHLHAVARIAELEGENAELKERVAMSDVTGIFKSLGEIGYIEQVDALNARIAELSQAVGLITTLKPTMVMDADHPLDMAKEVEAYVTARIDELTEYIGSQMADVYTLKARIAELKAESERFTAHSDIERQDDKWIPEVK